MKKSKQQLLAERIWDKIVEDMIFVCISEYSGCDPHPQLMEEQKELYFRLIEERLRLK